MARKGAAATPAAGRTPAEQIDANLALVHEAVLSCGILFRRLQAAAPAVERVRCSAFAGVRDIVTLVSARL